MLMRATGADKCTALPVLAAEDCELCPLVRCTYAEAGCAEVYCSEAHRARAWKRGHRLLCVGAPVANDAGAHASSAAAAAGADATPSKGSNNKRAKLDSKAGGASDASASASESAAAAAAAPSSSARSSSSSSAGGSSAAASSHPYAEFIAHAEQQHEFFIAAAQIAAQIACAIEDGQTEAEAV